MADPLCTLAQVRARLTIAAGDTSDDAILTELIDEISDYIADETGRKLVPEAAATYTVDTSSGSRIELPRGIRTVSALAIATTDQPDTGGAYTALSLADVLVRPSPAFRRPGWPGEYLLVRGTTARLSAALNGAQVTGDWGFAVTPPRIVAVAIDAVVAAFASHQSGASEVIGADANGIQPWSRYFAEGTPQEETLDRYRIGQGIGIA